MSTNALSHLPPPSGKRIAVHVKPAAERALRQGHPWVFDQAIRKQRSPQGYTAQPGDLAVIFDSKNRFLAVGLYDPDSPIRVKVLQHRDQAAINRAWFTDTLRAAHDRRQPLAHDPATNAYRLVHGENDHLPGLIVDRYANTWVMKLYTAAWLPHLPDVIAGLRRVQPFERLVLRASRDLVAQIAPYGLADGQVLIGDDLAGPVRFQENGLHFAADVAHGHKTGFFFDQRDNRAQVRAYAATLPDAPRVLDVFAYSGGFSVYAAAGGAQAVTSLDASAPALEAAQANFALNQHDPNVRATAHHTITGDAFAELERLHAARQTFDMVIVDPPSFAKSAAEVDRALAAYTRLTCHALAVLRPGGTFVMASCSSRIAADVFFATITEAAAQHRPLTELQRTGHALDHPIGFPEGAYLKCLFAVAP
ncbi:MAG: class I SAM-dependent methyltransferase [Anaerolineae bacterium]|nr:class I SAM-dependent methyltransferase [Anaerolineae bacterium]